VWNASHLAGRRLTRLPPPVPRRVLSTPTVEVYHILFEIISVRRPLNHSLTTFIRLLCLASPDGTSPDVYLLGLLQAGPSKSGVNQV
jgi:hypothetical protein